MSLGICIQLTLQKEWREMVEKQLQNILFHVNCLIKHCRAADRSTQWVSQQVIVFGWVSLHAQSSKIHGKYTELQRIPLSIDWYYSWLYKFVVRAVKVHPRSVRTFLSEWVVNLEDSPKSYFEPFCIKWCRKILILGTIRALTIATQWYSFYSEKWRWRGGSRTSWIGVWVNGVLLYVLQRQSGVQNMFRMRRRVTLWQQAGRKSRMDNWAHLPTRMKKLA